MTADPWKDKYLAGTKVKLTATPTEGWQFMGWQGKGVGSDLETEITINGDTAVSAQFGTGLTLTAIGGGNIKAYPERELYSHGSTVQLSAVPDDGKYLVMWGGDKTGTELVTSLEITKLTPTVSALFGAVPSGKATLRVEISGNGKVSVDPHKNLYDIGESVMITAEVVDGAFLGYTGDADQKEAILATKIDKNTTITANFVDFSKGLIAYYPFNGNASDESGNGNDGEVHGATLTEDRNGETGKAYSFDGSSTIAVPHSKETSLIEAESFTFSIWLNAESAGTHIFGKRSGAFNYQLDIHEGAAWFRGGATPLSDGIKDSESLDLNKWVNLIFTWDGESSTYHKNGQLTPTSFIENTPAIGPENNNPFLIGGSAGYTKFVGEIDDVRIYNRALSEAEVSALYELEKPLVPDDLSPPVITLSGEATVTLEAGTTYVDAGATATDNIDDSVSVTTSGSVDTDTPGTYTLTYTATDAVGTPPPQQER